MKCEVCGQAASISIGGVGLCPAHAEDVRAEIDDLRAQGKQVNAMGIARRMYREANAAGNYLLRDAPQELMDRAKQRALDDRCTMRDVILAALRSYL